MRIYKFIIEEKSLQQWNSEKNEDEIGGKIRETLLGFGIRHEYVHSLTVKLHFPSHHTDNLHLCICMHIINL